MKKFIVAAMLALSLSACGSQSIEPSTPEPSVEADDGLSQWSLSVPKDWSIERREHGLAMSDPAGEKFVLVTTMPLDDIKPEKFGEAFTMEAVENDEITVHDAKPFIVAGHQGARVVLQSEAVIMIHHVVGVGKLGYVLSCSYKSDTVMSDITKGCDQVLSSFSVR